MTSNRPGFGTSGSAPSVNTFTSRTPAGENSSCAVYDAGSIGKLPSAGGSYRSINNWGTVEETGYEGDPISALLERYGVPDSADFRILAPDGYFWPAVGDTLTLEGLSRTGPEGLVPIIAYEIEGRWKGPTLESVLDAAGITGPFKELRMEAWDGYIGRIPFEVAMLPDTIIAFENDGEPLPLEMGPVRLMVPSRNGFFWIRMITGVEVIR